MVTVIVVKVAIQNDDPWEVLQYAVAFALRGARKTVRGLKEALTENEAPGRFFFVLLTRDKQKVVWFKRGGEKNP